MEAGARSPTCMRAQEAKGVRASERRDVEVPMCTREQQRCADTSHAVIFLVVGLAPLGFYLGSNRVFGWWDFVEA